MTLRAKQKGLVCMTNKLLVEEIEGFAELDGGVLRTLGRQYIELMREKDRMCLLVAECRDAFDAIIPYADGITFSCVYAIKQAKETRERCEMAVGEAIIPESTKLLYQAIMQGSDPNKDSENVG
jgi:hypothetical protein